MWHPADPGMSAHGNGSLLDAVLAYPTIVGDVFDCAGMERRLIVSRTHPMSAAASVPPMRRSSESVCIARPREDIATGPFLDTWDLRPQVLPYGWSWDAACVYHGICTS